MSRTLRSGSGNLICFDLLLIRRELIWLLVRSLHRLIRLLDRLIYVLLIGLGSVRLYRLGCDGSESLTHGYLCRGMSEPVCRHEDPERTEQYNCDPDYLADPCEDQVCDLFSVIDAGKA